MGAFLAQRTGLLNGVIPTGGEALHQAGVVDAARRVREMGFGVSLHTAGVCPRALAKILPHIDRVGIDVKVMSDGYAAATGSGAGVKAWQSLDAVLEAPAKRARPALAAEAADVDGIVERADRVDQCAGTGRTVEHADVGLFDYEIRTTVYPGAPATERSEELLGGLRVRGVRDFVLQEARTDGMPVAFHAQASAWDRWTWVKRLVETVNAANRVGLGSFEARLA